MTTYRPAIDLARLVSAFAIVAFHAPGAPAKWLTISGLAFFLLLTFALQARSHSLGKSFSLTMRARRLLLPWVAWCFVYGGLKVARGLSPLPGIDESLFAVLAGPQIHLWFLPFAFAGSVAGLWLQRLAEMTGRAFPMLIAVSVLLALTSEIVEGKLPRPGVQWRYAVPLIPLGVMVGMTAERLMPTLVAIASTAAVAWYTDEPSYLIGLGILVIALPWKKEEMPVLRWLASLSMGIYLIHPLVFLFIHQFAPGASWKTFVFVGFSASAAASAALSLSDRVAVVLFGAPAPKWWS